MSNGERETEVGTSVPDSAAHSNGSAQTKLSENFREFSRALEVVCTDVADVGQFARRAYERLAAHEDLQHRTLVQPVLDSLYLVHDLAFREVQALEGGGGQTNAFAATLLQTLERELETHGVTVIRPHPGETLSVETMRTVESVPCPFWRKPETVARVLRCGYAQSSDGGLRLDRKAEVVIYGAKSGT